MKTVHVSRRDVLQAGGLAAAWMTLTACGPLRVVTGQGLAATTVQPSDSAVAATPAKPLTGDALLRHTLRRMSFGATEAMLDRARSIGLKAYVEEQLDYEALDDSEVEERMQSLDAMNLTLAEMFDDERRFRYVGECILATLMRQARSPRQMGAPGNASTPARSVSSVSCIRPWSRRWAKSWAWKVCSVAAGRPRRRVCSRDSQACSRASARRPSRSAR